MPTNLAIDDDLLEQAKLIGKHKTKKAAVTEALQEYIQRKKQTEVIKILIPLIMIIHMITNNSEENDECAGRYSIWSIIERRVPKIPPLK
jgi:hypothetical protein